MDREKQPKLDLPPEITDRITVIYDEPVDIILDDLDLDGLSEKYQDHVTSLVPIIMRWHNMPLILDDFENHNDRRAWKEKLESEYGQDSDEMKFVENNKLRGNKMNSVIGSIQPLLNTGTFDEQDEKRIKNEVSTLIALLHNLDFILASKVESITEILEILSGTEVRFNEEEFAVTVEGFLADLRLHVVRRLEKVSLEVVKKFVDREEREHRLMMEAAEKAAANAYRILPTQPLVDAEDEADFQDMAISVLPLEILAAVLEKIEGLRGDAEKLVRRVLEFGRKKE